MAPIASPARGVTATIQFRPTKDLSVLASQGYDIRIMKLPSLR
jgi:hypothetical protein